ncbi:MAG: aminodeoxychorismate lyase [Gammaproteobacteria bacterium]
MLVNGQLQSHLPVLDRAVQYGDGAFETILVRDSTPIFWDDHIARLITACVRLRIPLDLPGLLEEITQYLPTQNPSGILKIIISRGVGGRGYGVAETMAPSRILQFHELPENYGHNNDVGVSVFKCAHPVSTNSALAGIKHLNRLDQVMASMELPSSAQEGLMCSDAGLLIEGIKSNVFIFRDGQWVTPRLDLAGVAGVMRAQIIDFLQRGSSDALAIQALSFEELQAASEVFVCNSVFGIWPVTSLQWGDSMLEFSIGENTRNLQRSVWDSV